MELVASCWDDSDTPLHFVLETRGILHSKERLYLIMMALGSGLQGCCQGVFDRRVGFLILEVAWFRTMGAGYMVIGCQSRAFVILLLTSILCIRKGIASTM